MARRRKRLLSKVRPELARRRRKLMLLRLMLSLTLILVLMPAFMMMLR